MGEETEPKMQENKKNSEKKHKKVYRFLKKTFHDCKVDYNGLAGHDVSIQYQGNPKTWVEIKTCRKIVCNGIDHKKTAETNRRMLFNIHRLGRLKFDRRPIYPYVESQHDDLMKLDGWYVFFVGEQIGKHQILFGIKAKDVELTEKKGLKQREWSRLSMFSNPEWLEQLKTEVYK